MKSIRLHTAGWLRGPKLATASDCGKRGKRAALSLLLRLAHAPSALPPAQLQPTVQLLVTWQTTALETISHALLYYSLAKPKAACSIAEHGENVLRYLSHDSLRWLSLLQLHHLSMSMQ